MRILTGCEPHRAVEYDHVSAKQVESAPNVDVIYLTSGPFAPLARISSTACFIS